MVDNHYRWDFIGLSTDSKPTAASEKVVDGSTYYEADTSKLYVWCDDQWYEKEGGGTEYNDFVGTDGTAAGTAGLVPAPAIADVGKFLNANGLWETITSGSDVFVIQTSSSAPHRVTTSYQDIKNAFNAGKILLLDGWVSNEFNTSIKAFGIGWNKSHIGGQDEEIGSTGTTDIYFYMIGKNSTSAEINVMCEFITMDNDNQALQSSGYVNSTVCLTGEIYQRSNMANQIPSTQAVVRMTGYKSNLTTTNKNTIVDGVNEIVTNLGGLKFQSLTQAQYDALATKDANTVYIIKAS